MQELERFTRDAPDADCRLVLVVEQRALSQAIARRTGIPHQSPQALLFRRGEVVWHASHYSLTTTELAKSFQAAAQ